MKRIKITVLDALFSKLVRNRSNWTCERCGTVYPENSAGLQCSHLFGRRSAATRVHSLNAVAHCAGCHSYLTANPDTFSKWMREYRGDEVVDRLKYLHGLPITLKSSDHIDIRADLKAQLAQVRTGDDFETPAVILLAIERAEQRRK